MEPVTCPGCQKSYAYKPELAGKRVKCRCGGVLAFPLAQPAAEAVDDGQYDLVQPEPVAKVVGGKCPGCGAKTPNNAVICVSCGLNFKTGQKLRTTYLVDTGSPPAPGGAVPPRIPRGSGKSSDPKDPHAAENKRKLIVMASIVAGLALLVGGSVLALKFIGDSTDGGAITQSLGDDAEALRLINDDGGIEAKQWITEDPNRRMLGYLNVAQTIARVENLYKLGAVKVYCSGPAICLTAVVELPADPEQRKALFEWSREWDARHRNKHTPDVGQRFMTVNVPMGPPG